jgi:hypothetical protein
LTIRSGFYQTLKSYTRSGWRAALLSDFAVLVLIALVKLGLHLLTNGQYGFHRDELGMLDDARYLAWGYVSYPPFTPFMARVALVFFGPSLVGLRFFSALAQSIAMVLAGLMARELGGKRLAQLVAALAVAIAPISLAWSSLFHYSSFDYLWWVLIASLTVRLLNSGNSRYWLGIGVAIGLGMLTKYSIAVYIAGIVVGVFLSSARRYLLSWWLWGSAALALLIFLPNLIWQIQHNFIHLQFLSFIHARDVAIGRTQSFLVEQLYIAANPVAIPLWLAGLYYYFRAPAGRRYRMLGWMAIVPFILLLIMQGRSYYTGPLYPLLIAAGAVYGEQRLATLPAARVRSVQTTLWRSLAIGGLITIALVLPLAPINSTWWTIARAMYVEPREEIGWPELVQTVAGIYASLPKADRSQTAILTNYSEAGAINLFGPAKGLPEAITSENSGWLRGYGNPPPKTLIIVGWNRADVDRIFETCTLAGHVTNAYGVENEDALYHHDIFICRGPRESWPELWQHVQSFG